MRASFLAAAFSDGSYLAHVNGTYLRHVKFCIVRGPFVHRLAYLSTWAATQAGPKSTTANIYCLNILQEQIEVERCEFKAEMKRAYEAEIEAKEHSLLERLDREQEQLREEKRTVEETLQKEMERVLDEKNNHLKVVTLTF